MNRLKMSSWLFVYTFLWGTTPIAFSSQNNVNIQYQNIVDLSEERIQGYLSGRGMGQAKVAELNGYPGPRHVLDRSDLKLSDVQRKQIEELFEGMLEQSKTVGEAIVKAHSKLNTTLANHNSNSEEVRSLLGQISELKSELQFVHIKAHLETHKVLTSEQLNHYYHTAKSMHHSKSSHSQ